MITSTKQRLVLAATMAYFAVAMAVIMAELFTFVPMIVVFKPLMPFLLMVLYALASSRRHLLFFLAMVLSLVTNIFFIPDDPDMLFWGVLVFTFHRIVVLILMFRLLRLKDYIPAAIATIPFLLVFFYLLAISTEIPPNSIPLLAVQNMLISILGGLALSGYIMIDDRKNTWLLICGLLFVALQFIVFLEKYYLTDISPFIFRPIAMGLNAAAFYTFYEFVISVERSNENSPAT